MWNYTECNGLAYYWALDDQNYHSGTPFEPQSNLLNELSSRVRDVYETLQSQNIVLNNLYEQVELLVGDRLTPIELEQLRILFES